MEGGGLAKEKKRHERSKRGLEWSKGGVSYVLAQRAGGPLLEGGLKRRSRKTEHLKDP